MTMAYADTIVEAYDFEAERWVTLTEKPSLTFGAEACYMKGKLHTIGGVQAKQVDQYDLETNTWAAHFPRQVKIDYVQIYWITEWSKTKGIMPNGLHQGSDIGIVYTVNAQVEPTEAQHRSNARIKGFLAH